MTFHIGSHKCAVCGGDKCEHLVNRNGGHYDPEVMWAALHRFIGRPVTVQLQHEIRHEIAGHLPVMPPTMELLGVYPDGDQIRVEIGEVRG